MRTNVLGIWIRYWRTCDSITNKDGSEFPAKLWVIDILVSFPHTPNILIAICIPHFRVSGSIVADDGREERHRAIRAALIMSNQ